MIDKYLEKDIIRQITITKLLFKNEQLNVKELGDYFKISRNTLVSYIAQIEEIILEDEGSIRYDSGEITLIGKENIILYQLCQRISRRSKWLSFVCKFIDGNSIEEISESSYLSMASIYRYKKQLDEYLVNVKKKDALSHDIDNECSYRMFKTYLFFLSGIKVDCMNTLMCDRHESDINDFINSVSEELQREYLPESCEYIKLALFIVIDELTKGYGLRISARLKEDLSHFYIFKAVKQNLKRHNLDTIIKNEDEIFFVAALFIQLSYLTSNIDVFETEVERINCYYLEHIPEYKDLLSCFQLVFGKKSTNNIIFYKTIIRFLNKMSLDCQEFLPDQEIENEKNCLIKEKIEIILKKWTEKYLDDDYHYREKSIIDLVNRMSIIINAKDQYWVKIVATTDFECQVIKSAILKQDCEVELCVDPRTYLNLSKAMGNEDGIKLLIVCTEEKFYPNSNKTIKVSLKTLQTDIITGLQKYELL